MTFEMAQLSIFGANLRNFDLLGLIEEGLVYLDQLKPLTPMDPLMSDDHPNFVKFSFEL